MTEGVGIGRDPTPQIFEEVKKLRKCKPVVANSIDGVTEKIPSHFAGIYQHLYNSVEDQPEVIEVSETLEADENL